MKSLKLINTLLVIIALFAIHYNSCANDKPAPIITFISDTQAPIWLERLTQKAEKNEEATDILFQDIIKEHPKSLFIVGDLVSASSKSKSWNMLDHYIEEFKNSNIAVNSVIGNHEYQFSTKKAKENYFNRFPQITEIGYFRVIDSIAVVVLNSTIEKLSTADNNRQNEWYGRIMDSLNLSTSIKLIIVACHHSPFTNSTVVSDSKKVQKYFVPKYLECSKAKLFISGHSHNLEHFKYKQKEFLVIGGGGGVKQPLKKPANRIWKDLIPDNEKPRFFYVIINKSNGKFSLTVRGVNNEDLTKFKEIDLINF